MADAGSPFAAVPALRPVSGLQVKNIAARVGILDPVEAVQKAAARAGYTVLSKNRADIEQIAAAAMAASHGIAVGECDVLYDHPIQHQGDVIQEDWNRGWTVFVTKALMGGLGFVTAPATSRWTHPQSRKRYLRFTARALPLRPADPPVVAEARRAVNQ